MKNITLLVITTYLVTIFSSCGIDHSDPQEVLQAYLDNQVKRNYEKSYELITSKSKEFVTENEFLILEKGVDSTWDDKLSYSNLIPIEKDIDKPTYRRFKVDYMNIHESDTSKFRVYYTLLNENNKWRICWVDGMLKQAGDKVRDGNYSESIKISEKAIEINPFSAIAYSIIGNCYRLDNSLSFGERKKGMLNNFTYALTLESDQPYNYNNLAMYYNSTNENNLAIEQFKKAINFSMTEKEKARYYRNISFCYNDDEIELAFENAKKATEIDPNHAPNWERLGFLQYESGNYQEANKSFEKALSLPELPNYLKSELFYEYALNLTALNNWAKAKEYVLKGLEIEPDNQRLKELYAKINQIQ